MNEAKMSRLEGIGNVLKHARSLVHVPKPEKEGWTKCPVDPGAILEAFPSLHLEDGFVLRAYQFYDGGNGNAFVYVMPADAPWPEPDECPRAEGEFLEPPFPPDAVHDGLSVLRGDGTPLSYMCASLLARELSEFGAFWHGCSWGCHHLLDHDPFAGLSSGGGGPDAELPTTDEGKWTWEEDRPDDWRPAVAMDSNGVTVTFFTFTALGRESINRYVDTYGNAGYRFETKQCTTAQGGGGFVF